jgi:hypothetical protein
MPIKGLMPQLAERGKVKIGEKGEMKTSQGGKQFSQPRKLDHFVITTMQRDAAGRLLPDTALMARLKPEGGKLTEIPVRLLYDHIDLNFQTRYACYRGNRCWCSGDGEIAQRFTGENGKYQEVTCPCEHQDPFYQGQDRCKILGTLQVLIEGTNRIGGVWKFRTTSWNTVNAILSSLALIKTITGGPLAGIPLHLVLSPKTVTIPTTGQNMVVYVVSLEFRGPEEVLAELGYEIARRRIEHQVKMEQIEAEARRLLLLPQAEPPEEQEEVAQEFYPETAAALAEASPCEVCHCVHLPTEPCPVQPSRVEFVTCGVCGSQHFKSDPCPICHKGNSPYPEPGFKVTEIPTGEEGVIRFEIEGAPAGDAPYPDHPGAKDTGKKHLKPVANPAPDKKALF